MSVTARIQSLKAKHADLDQQIDSMASAPVSDELQMQKLKRERLALKDEIASLESRAA